MAKNTDKSATDKTEKTAMKRFTLSAPKANREDGMKISIRTMPVSLLGGKLSEAFKQIAEETGKSPEMVRGTLTVYLK